MFERYTMRARQAVFYARFEAGRADARFVGAPHLLLGALRADPGLVRRFVLGEDAVETLRKELLALDGEVASIATSRSLPLDHPAKRALAYAAEESEREGLREIAAGHLLLGVMREAGPARDALLQRGLDLSECRQRIREEAESPGFDEPRLEI